MKQISYIFLLLAAVSCHNNDTSYISFENFNFPILIDTLNIDPTDRKESWLATSTYEVLYIGNHKDTIYVNYRLPFHEYIFASTSADSSIYNLESSKYPKSDYFLDWQDERYFKYWDEAFIEILIDTTKIIKNEEFLVDADNKFYKAYPVLLTNNQMDTLTIGYGEYLPITMEARDSVGIWRRIEEEWIYACGVGIGAIILPPKQVALTSALIYHGNYKTDLRLRLGENYSSTFRGSIDYQQFEDIYDEYGHYSDKYLESKRE